MNKFNLRVYGILVNEQTEVLITNEELNNFRFTKFPGGGLEIGEGLIQGLKREFLEECNLEIEVIKHFYTTDFYVKSLFGDEQLISVYYLVKPKGYFSLKISSIPYDFENQIEGHQQSFRMLPIKDISESDFTFPIDKYLVKLLKEQFIS
jgi:8-oxo-dGTP diphosphatase